ncbi:MAG: hypothetical protein R3185_00970 [Candidatus Thermoplasmatota archaeon]|nr:hypothetical protein [Candidatus Thermoplasmatota archaeon]
MASRQLATLLALLLLLTAPLAAAQEAQSPITIQVLDGETPVEEVEAGLPYALQTLVDIPEDRNASWRAFVNTTVGNLTQAGFTQANTSQDLEVVQSFTVPGDAQGTLTIAYEVTVQYLNHTTQQAGGDAPTGNETADTNQTADGNQTQENATAPPPTWQDAFSQAGPLTLAIKAPPTPPPAAPPVGLYVGGALLALLLIGGVVVYLKRPRQYQHETGRRSKTLAQLDAEDKGEDPVQVQATQEPEVHPQLKILEARAQDVRRMIELAKERHERGDITEHQFNMIRDKKEGELQAIEEEMDQYRNGS